MKIVKENMHDIICSSDLDSLSQEYIELILDSMSQNEIIDNIPVVKTLVSLVKLKRSISDHIFIKKAMAAILEIGQINAKLRNDFINELADDNSTGIEKFMFKINHLDSLKKSKIFGKLCKIKAENRISLKEYYRMTNVLQKAYLDDFILLKDFSEKEKGEVLSESEYYSIISLGLIYQGSIEQEPIKYIEEGGDDYGTWGPNVEGGEIHYEYFLSNLGVLFWDHYDELFK
jgi:hypothetical protein